VVLGVHSNLSSTLSGFYAIQPAWNASVIAWTSYDKAVCPSVKCVDSDKLEESSVQIFYTV